jgi:hypothetical protein
MANEEQLSILKQGAQPWNEWRYLNLRDRADFTRANLRKSDLTGVNLSEAILYEADLSEAMLREANLSRSDLRKVNFQGAELVGANIRGAKLQEANLIANFAWAKLTGANLAGADVREANLSGVDLREANLTGADLSGADLSYAEIKGSRLAKSNLSNVRLFETIFLKSDLSETIGLEDVVHAGPSTIGTDTLVLSKGQIPEVFLRGCGLSDWEIEQVKLYNPDLSNKQFIDIQHKIFDLRNRQALQITPLFISYSHADSGFVDKIGNSLTSTGVRYWRDIHEMKAGRMEKQVDRAISQNPTVLLVLSENSLSSDWVEHEVRTARGLEKAMGRDVLCPVALDDSWKDSRWPKRLMEQIMEYNILDFSEWQDDSKFDGMLRKLIDGLELFYKG